MTGNLSDLFSPRSLVVQPRRLSPDEAIRHIGEILARGWARSRGLDSCLDESRRPLAPWVSNPDTRTESHD